MAFSSWLPTFPAGSFLSKERAFFFHVFFCFAWCREVNEMRVLMQKASFSWPTLTKPSVNSLYQELFTRFN